MYEYDSAKAGGQRSQPASDIPPGRGLISLVIFLVSWLGIGFLITLPILSSYDSGLMLITNSGFRTTGAIIEIGNYDNPQKVTILLGNSITFKNATAHTVRLCIGQDGDCDAQQSWGITLDPGESLKIPFGDIGTYDLTISATGGPPFLYKNLTIEVPDQSSSD